MILCCGEALIDMLPRETTAGEAAFAPYVGGAVFNTAVALGRLDLPAGFFTGISTDFYGDMLRDALVASNVTLDFIKFADLPTTLAFVRLSGGHASYLFYDENTAGRMLVESDLPAVGDAVEAMHFSCVSLIQEPCGATYEALMRREHGKRVMMFDPNIRKNFIKDKPKHLARMKRMLAMADIVKLSDEDLDWFGESGSLEEIAARWLQLGPSLMVVTQGAKGVLAFSKSHAVSVPATPVTVVDTVGAGDTINAGILASLRDQGLLSKQAIATLSEEQIRTMLAFSVKAAAITVSRAGANPPWRRELA
ncbi:MULTISPECIES: carbohydrate kinase family protein [Phyllobacteriaceae]|jgi:fructokinase|uniref:Carbohydrate kinase n=1 Tax=Mesorhizobium hungaricum TaxID=1566387 RepID=A0A1C2DJH2_9HYPH|nr:MULTISPECIES: carbohydrate kinase [Mesorhizobium]MBN9233197.1 carbohydrate kinase [Mesorhizobium sp.]MDQ0332116.1 fructokinase [Mesorhizobium sp. YL-MeA3-2017]OCX14805.1 carbohydrate kinase [Mesorhizobium hungaricum]